MVMSFLRLGRGAGSEAPGSLLVEVPGAARRALLGDLQLEVPVGLLVGHEQGIEVGQEPGLVPAVPVELLFGGPEAGGSGYVNYPVYHDCFFWVGVSGPVPLGRRSLECPTGLVRGEN